MDISYACPNNNDKRNARVAKIMFSDILYQHYKTGRNNRFEWRCKLSISPVAIHRAVVVANVKMFIERTYAANGRNVKQTLRGIYVYHKHSYSCATIGNNSDRAFETCKCSYDGHTWNRKTSGVC